MKKIISLGLLIAVLVVGYVYFFVYNKSHPDYANQKPDFELKAETLYSDFSNNNDSKRFLGKVILINGELSAVEATDSLAVLSFYFEEGLFGSQGVRCSMLFSETRFNIGDKIEVKGVCSGYNDTDVLLENCSIVKE